jgi:hypothetical protein
MVKVKRAVRKAKGARLEEMVRVSQPEDASRISFNIPMGVKRIFPLVRNFSIMPERSL